MENLKNKFDGVIDRPDFRYAGPLWGVAEDYELVGFKDKEVVTKRTGKWRPYAPLQEPDLFLSFARLASRGAPSEQSVLRWVRKYGLLQKADKDKSDLKLPNGELNQAPVLVKEFAAESLEARSALDLYTDLSKGALEDLKKRMGVLREEYERGRVLSEIDRYLVSEHVDPYFTSEWGVEVGIGPPYVSEHLQFLATVELEGFVEGKLNSVRPALWSDYALGSSVDRYRPTQSWTGPDLISAVYLQFYLLMTKNLAMRRCENPACGMPIPVTRRNRKFCNPTCRSNMRHYQ